jgi:putative transposase
MRKSKFSESQIVSILKEADSGIPVAEVLRNHGVSAATFYKWRSKYGGLEASDLKRIKELEQQLAEFKTIVADLTLENKGMRGLLSKKL